MICKSAGLRYLIILVVTVVLFAAVATAALAAEQQKKPTLLPDGTLTADQLTALFSDKTVESITAVKERVSLSYYASDGKMRQTRNGQTRFGTWRVRADGRICLQMEQLREKCRIIVKKDGIYKKYIVRKSGRHQNTVNYLKFWSGNPFGL